LRQFQHTLALGVPPGPDHPGSRDLGPGQSREFATRQRDLLLFFTFFGLDAVSRKRHEHIKVASVGNPGLHLATLIGALPGVPGLMTHYMEHKMDKLDIPPILEFLEMIADTGAGIYGCKASRDLFELAEDDLIDQVKDIITVSEFYELAAGGQIIFT
jgi:peroxiredoxin family protein